MAGVVLQVAPNGAILDLEDMYIVLSVNDYIDSMVITPNIEKWASPKIVQAEMGRQGSHNGEHCHLSLSVPFVSNSIRLKRKLHVMKPQEVANRCVS